MTELSQEYASWKQMYKGIGQDGLTAGTHAVEQVIIEHSNDPDIRYLKIRIEKLAPRELSELRKRRAPFSFLNDENVNFLLGL
jgi:hypothetical protein